jgi:hypothetical protein
MNKDEARDAAIEAARGKACLEVFTRDFNRLIGDKQNDFVVGFVGGYDAGREAERCEIAEWIPIRSEADLPKKSGFCLVTTNFGTVEFRFLWVSSPEHNSNQFTAYMPLPPPYKPEDGK